MAISDLANIDKTSRLAVSWGRHPVRGYQVKHDVQMVANDKQVTVHRAVGDGEWNALTALYYGGIAIDAANIDFHRGTKTDSPYTHFLNEPPHPYAPNYTVRLPVGMAADDDPDKLVGIFECLKIANYDGDGVQVDASGSVLPGGADPRDYYFYSPSPARVMVDAFIRWSARRATRVNWPKWVDWRDWLGEELPTDDGTYTPQNVTGTAGTGGALSAGGYYIRIVSLRGVDVSSGSFEVFVTVAASGSVSIHWDQVTSATGYRVYIGVAEDAEDRYFTIAGGAVTTYNLTTLAGATVAPVPPTATGALLVPHPRFEAHIFTAASTDLRVVMDKLCQITCSDYQICVSGKVVFLSPIARDPILTLDLTKLKPGTFKEYPSDRKTRPNRVTVNFRDLANQYLAPANPPAIVNRALAQQADGDRIRNLDIDGGGMYRWHAMRVASYWARSLCDMKTNADWEASPNSYAAIPADDVLVIQPGVDWENVRFKIMSSEDDFQTSIGRNLKLRVTRDDLYSDSDYSPLPQRLPPPPLNGFIAPPQVVSVTLSETGVLQQDQTYVSILRGVAQAAEFIGSQNLRVYQKLRVYLARPSDYSVDPPTDAQYKVVDHLLLEPNPVTLQAAFEIPGVEAGKHYIKVVPESILGVQASRAAATAYNITITGKASAPAPPGSITLSRDVSGLYQIATLTPSSDGDIKQYEIKRLTSGIEVFVDAGMKLEFKIPEPLPAGTTAIRAYARNWSGVLSTFYASAPYASSVPNGPTSLVIAHESFFGYWTIVSYALSTSTDVKQYELYRVTGGVEVLMDTTTGNHFRFQEPLPASTTHLRVYARNYLGTRSTSYLEAAYGADVPAAVTGITVTPNQLEGKNRVFWTPSVSTNVYKYEVFTVVGGVETFLDSTLGNAVIDPNVQTPGTSRTYRVYAVTMTQARTNADYTYALAAISPLASLTLTQVKGFTSSGPLSVLIQIDAVFQAYSFPQRAAIWITRPGDSERFHGYIYPNNALAGSTNFYAATVGTYTVRSRVEDYNGNFNAVGQLSRTSSVTQLQSIAWVNDFPTNFTFKTLPGPVYRWDWGPPADPADAARTKTYQLYAIRSTTGVITLIYEGPNNFFHKSGKFLAGLMSEYDFKVYPVDSVGNVGTFASSLNFHLLYATSGDRVDVSGDTITITEDALIATGSILSLHTSTTLDRQKVTKTAVQVRIQGGAWPTLASGTDRQIIYFGAPEEVLAFWMMPGPAEIRVGMGDEFGNWLWSNTLTHNFNPAVSDINADAISFWPIDEEPGTTRVDLIGGQDLADNGIVGQTLGRGSVAGNFVGSAPQFLSRASSSLLQIGDYDFTFAGWVMFAQRTTHMGIVGKYTDAAPEYALFYNQTVNKIRWSVFASAVSVATVDWSAVAATSVWYHVIAWHDSVNNLLGLQVNNGTPATITTGGIVPATGATQFRLGNLAEPTSYNYGLYGKMSRWRRWNRLLTTSEKKDLFLGLR